jgi:hypothetical protein
MALIFVAAHSVKVEELAKYSAWSDRLNRGDRNSLLAEGKQSVMQAKINTPTHLATRQFIDLLVIFLSVWWMSNMFMLTILHLTYQAMSHLYQL